MPQDKIRAYVLGQSPLGEQDKTVFLLSESQGILRAIAPGSHKGTNRFGSLMELFTEGDFIFYWKETKETITISSGEIVTSYFELVSDPGNIFYFFLIAEIILKFVPRNHRDPRLYRLVTAVLESRRQGVMIPLLLLYFMIWILKLEGLLFNPRQCVNCQKGNLRQAWLRADFRGLLCGECRHDEKWSINDPELEFISWAMSNHPNQLNTWIGKMDFLYLLKIIKSKIEHHGEFSLSSSRYLAEFR